MNNPFFSVAVVCLNAEDTIKQTLDSILNQSCNDFEIVVKDGISKDGTLEKIPDNEKIHVYSKKDIGIYDAMNQVVEYCNGEYIVFMNCGDSFADEKVLEHVKAHILGLKVFPAIVYGDYMRKDIYCKQPSELTEFYLYRTGINHQSMFFAKSLFYEVGMYDASMRIYADYELILRTFMAGKSFSYVELLICEYMGDGISESPKLQEIRKSEHKECIDRYFTKEKQKKYNRYIKMSFYKLRQKLASDKCPRWLKKIYRGLVNKLNG